MYQGGSYDIMDQPTGSVTSSQLAAARRVAGTVYGGQTGRPTTANADAPIDASGSLTGMILARGRSVPQPQVLTKQQRSKRRWRTIRRVSFIALGVLAFIAAIAATVAILAGDFIRSLFHIL